MSIIKGINKEKFNIWLSFIGKANLLDEYNHTLEDEIQKLSNPDKDMPDTRTDEERREMALIYIKEHPPIISFIPKLESALTDRNILQLFNSVFCTYNAAAQYSLLKSKEIILESLQNLSKKYESQRVPLIYTSFQFPNQIYFNPLIWRELFGSNSFRNEDYGKIDLINALLELEEEGLIKIESLIVMQADNEKITLKTIIENTKPIRHDSKMDFPLSLNFNEITREIKINNVLMAKPDFDRINHSIIEYLFKNANRTISRKELSEQLNTTVTKNFMSFLNDINIKGVLRKYLFNVSKNSIQLIAESSITDKKDAQKAREELKKYSKK